MDSQADDIPTPEPIQEPSPPPIQVVRTKRWRDHPMVRRLFLLSAGIAILICTWCIYISRMPKLFDVNQQAVEDALRRGHIESPDQPLLTGYTSVSTALELTRWLLKKPGGYLYNDRLAPNAYLIDNMKNFEFGVVLELRDTVTAFRNTFSRSRGQSEELVYLNRAMGDYNFDENSWMIPATESRFNSGRRHLETYLQEIVDQGDDSGLFVNRQDVLERYLNTRADRLGSFSVRLRSSAAKGYAFNPNRGVQDLTLTPDPISPEYTDSRNTNQTPWNKRDDVFYEIRGSVWVMYHMMLALRTDFEGELNEKRAMGQMNRILSELYAASQPMVFPVVLNGSEFGLFHNHSLTAAAHIAKAHVAVNDLRILLRGGSDG